MVRVHRLLSVLKTISGDLTPPADVGAAIAAAAATKRPLPQVTWLILVMIYCYQRVLWASKEARERLTTQFKRWRQGNHDQAGVVPGMEDWDYELTEVGWYLCHRGTGEQVAIHPFRDQPKALVRDTLLYLDGDPSNDPARNRLAALLPKQAGVNAVLHALRTYGLVESHLCEVVEGGAPYDWMIRYADAAERFLTRWSDPSQRSWLAAIIGD
jgi:hypothetical protein